MIDPETLEVEVSQSPVEPSASEPDRGKTQLAGRRMDQFRHAHVDVQTVGTDTK